MLQGDGPSEAPQHAGRGSHVARFGVDALSAARGQRQARERRKFGRRERLGHVERAPARSLLGRVDLRSGCIRRQPLVEAPQVDHTAARLPIGTKRCLHEPIEILVTMRIHDEPIGAERLKRFALDDDRTIRAAGCDRMR